MFTIHEKNLDLATNGVLVAVKLWVPRAMKSSLEPIETMAEIGTSFAHTYIQEGIATSLGLEPTGVVTITTATKPLYEALLFTIRLIFPQGNLAFEVKAIEVPYMIRPKTRIKCLIGRDVLQHTVLTYNGRSNMFSLEFRA